MPRKSSNPLCMQAVLFLFLSLTTALFSSSCSKDKGKTVLAEVNGQPITINDYNRELESLPEQARALYRQRPDALLQRLIGMTILLQEAKARGLVESSSLQSLSDPKVQEALTKLVDQVTQGQDISEDEVRKFYDAHKDDMEGRSFDDVKEPIRFMLKNLRGQKAMESFVQGLVAKANINTYEDRLPKPPPPVFPSSSPEELDKALNSGRPTLVDFGSDFCGPCIRLRPILKALKETHKDRINVLYVDVDAHKDLASRYQVRFLPTLVFFNSHGKEIKRKMGYMEREALEKILSELGFLSQKRKPS